MIDQRRQDCLADDPACRMPERLGEKLEAAARLVYEKDSTVVLFANRSVAAPTAKLLASVEIRLFQSRIVEAAESRQSWCEPAMMGGVSQTTRPRDRYVRPRETSGIEPWSFHEYSA